VLGLSEGSKELGDNLLNAGHTHGGNVTSSNRGDYRAHHIIPHKVWTDNGQFFHDIGLGNGNVVNSGGKDRAANGVWLPKSRGVATRDGFDLYHAGNHSTYSNRVRSEVEGIRDRFNSNQMNRTQARRAIRDLQRREKRNQARRNSSGGCSGVIR
jgi:hypothetical protein